MTTRTSQAGRAVSRPGGFTYLLMLAAIAILAVSAQALTTLNSHVVRAEREAELLFRGQAYRNAIARYVRTGPDHSLPRNLTDLLNEASANGWEMITAGTHLRDSILCFQRPKVWGTYGQRPPGQ